MAAEEGKSPRMVILRGVGCGLWDSGMQGQHFHHGSPLQQVFHPLRLFPSYRIEGGGEGGGRGTPCSWIPPGPRGRGVPGLEAAAAPASAKPHARAVLFLLTPECLLSSSS